MSDQSFFQRLERARSYRTDHVRGRYAPSPTGALHLGNLRTALYAWLQVRLSGGQLVLRMEDLDQPRSVAGSAEQILDDLRWLGLTWDEGPDIGGPLGPYVQSARTAIYEEVLDLLREQGKVFQCYCSRRDVRKAASAPHGPGGPVYPGTCRDLSDDQARARQANHPNRTPAWRFRVADRTISVVDAIAGDYAEHLARDVGDFVVRRADELFAYQLAVVVDDALMGITDVVRGADLLSSTPRQIALFEALDAEPPRFWHAPLMLDDEGNRLSKRDGSDSLRVLRDECGWQAPQVIGHLAESLGWVPPDTHLSAPELLAELTLEDLKKPTRAGTATGAAKMKNPCQR